MKTALYIVLYFIVISNYSFSITREKLERSCITQVLDSPIDSSKVKFIRYSITDDFRILKNDHRIIERQNFGKNFLSFSFPIYDGHGVVSLDNVSRLTKKKPCLIKLDTTENGHISYARLVYKKFYAIIRNGILHEYGYIIKGKVFRKYNLKGFINGKSWPVRYLNDGDFMVRTLIYFEDQRIKHETIYSQKLDYKGANVKSIVNRRKNRQLKYRHEEVLCN